MEISTIAVIIAIFALIVVAVLLVFRKRAKIKITGPVGTGLEVNASNEPSPSTPAIVVEDAESREGGLLTEDGTGRGVHVRRTTTQDDILISTQPPTADSDPKAPPPA